MNPLAMHKSVEVEGDLIEVVEEQLLPVAVEDTETQEDMASDATTKAKKQGTSPFKKVKKVGKTIYKVLKSHAGLIILLVIYTAIGGAIFSALEGPFETSEAIAMNATREKFLVDMRKALGQRKWNEESRELLDDFEEKMKYYFSHARDIEDGEVKQVWTFIGALVYSMTVYTTIGYGHIAPVTDGGKVATVIYAIIGIPLCLLVMADLGRLMTKGIKGLFALIKRFYYTGQLSRMRKTKAVEFLEKKLDMKSQGDLNKSTEAQTEADADGKTLLYGYEIDDEFNLPVSVALAIVGIYLFCCAAIYTRFEDWSYGDALYFLFVSMSTIGFGDFVPENQEFFLASSLLVLFGLSLVSMTITVLVDYIADLYKKAKDKIQAKVTAIGDKIGIDVTALDKLMTKNDDDDDNGKNVEEKENEDQEAKADDGEVESKSEPEAETKKKETGEAADGEEEKAPTPTDGKSKIPQRKKDD
ncbi:TWiK family of potassium channels protein 18-like isoform X2 [Lineus longissimus]|uniref:TWiK family of potassium channels protein 18-like isoform X2 n=1 Tax=Lineus longissimus TaxID=88925 RepID=UPI00315D7CDA